MQPPELSGIPKTMLWTLYHRAVESAREDAILKDPAAEQVLKHIDFDFFQQFGPPDGSIASRARMFDEVVEQWLGQHPGGTVVELGCGLETQCQRIGNEQANWVFVDLPQALAWRKRLITDPPRSRHLGQDCFALKWLRQVDEGKGVMVTAQGLLMYFPEQQVRSLIAGIAQHFSSVDMLFDILPLWASLWTTSPAGLWRSPFYRVPPMPWGVSPSHVEAVLQSWTDKPVRASWQSIRMIRPYSSQWLRWMGSMPLLQDQLPAVVHARLGNAARQPFATGSS